MTDYHENSRLAWLEIQPVSGKLDADILRALHAAGKAGLICQEIEAAISREHQSVSGNLRHLKERGLVVETTEKRKTRSGRWATVCIAVWHAPSPAATQQNLF